jgi:hypothetical protein
MNKAILMILLSLSVAANAKDLDTCSNYYNSLGKLIKEADYNSCENISFFIKTKESTYKQFKLNAPDEEDKILLSSPPREIAIITLAKVKEVTKEVPENTIFDAGSFSYAASESYGDLDFGFTLPQNSLIGDTLYGSRADSGNFLWGYAMAKMGTPIITTKIGAELNAILWHYKHTWDGVGDRRAINNGYAYFIKNISKSQISKRILDIVFF